MKRLALSFAAVVAAVSLAQAAYAGDVGVIVGFKGGTSGDRCSIVHRHGGRVGCTIGSAGAIAAVVPACKLAALRADPSVAFVERDGIVEASGWWDWVRGLARRPQPPPTPPQPAQSRPWGVTRVNGAPTSSSGAGIDVAVIDTGIELTHPDLAANVGGGVSFVWYTGSPNDDNGHGTHVAGTIAAIDNSIGVIGVAPGARLHPVKVLDSRGSGYLSAVASGIDWCVAHGIKVANMSLGASSGSATLQASCDAANAAGVLLIAAAGNSGDGSTATNEIGYPASYASVVSVAAIDSGDVLASFSNTNADVEVSGPGVSVLSTYKGSTYATLSGTSMATPHAVGVAALLWADAIAAASAPTNATVRDVLKAAAQDAGPVGRDNGYGVGIVHHP
jgi:subtilisin family serine protease